MRKVIKYSILMLVLFMIITICVGADSGKLPFTDVSEDAWYYSTVAEAYEAGLMKGTSATTFAPGGIMTRCEFVTLLSRIAGADTVGCAETIAGFTDGDTSAWYAEAMGWGVKCGLIKGFTDNTVRPMQTITRAELAVMIVRYLDFMGYRLPDAAEDGEFTDADKILDWCRTEIDTCRRYGIFSGDEAGRFNPSNEATRAEGATIALRLTKAIDALLEAEGVVLARRGEDASFTVFYNFGADGNLFDAEYFVERIGAELDIEIGTRPYSAAGLEGVKLQFIANAKNDPDVKLLQEDLGENGYAMKLVRSEGYNKIAFAYSSNFAKAYAIEYLLTKYQKDGALAVPVDFEIKGNVTQDEVIYTDYSIKENTRDPSILYENGVYYAYTTGWNAYKNTSGSLKGDWEKIPGAVIMPDDFKAHNWAPEVYKYNGKYYMFTTYSPTETLNEFGNRGCIIMRSDSPEGPFKMITDGWVTPKEWDCIDGTFYVDGDGQPWMVFVHGHTSLEGNGAMAAVKLSDDLTRQISEPIELFRANEPLWADAGIADGCFMHTTENGDLLMIWSNVDKKGYCLGVARSSNGRLDGEWTHEDPRLFSRVMADTDGGHGMIFTDVDGQMYVFLHSPNTEEANITLLPIIERNGMLVWDLNLD